MFKSLETRLVWKGLVVGAMMLVASIASSQNVQIPADQRQFVSIVTGFIDPYTTATNDLLKSRQRRGRKAALEEAFPNTGFSNWVGTLTRLGTTGDGDAYVGITLAGTNIIINTTNNGFSESLSRNKTLVKDGTAVFEQLIQLSEGDIVTISGNFFSGRQDHFSEGSLTERGSMVEPAYLIAVSSIKRYSR